MYGFFPVSFAACQCHQAFCLHNGIMCRVWPVASQLTTMGKSLRSDIAWAQHIVVVAIVIVHKGKMQTTKTWFYNNINRFFYASMCFVSDRYKIVVNFRCAKEDFFFFLLVHLMLLFFVRMCCLYVTFNQLHGQYFNHNSVHRENLPSKSRQMFGRIETICVDVSVFNATAECD